MGVSADALLEGGGLRVAEPQFSIITASMNQGSFLRETLASVRAQGRTDVEHIVIDGGSTDDSVAVLRDHEASLSYWVSAPDGGQPNAWNAGLRRARGRYVGFLNSDDLYLPGALDAVAHLARDEPQAEWLLGGTLYFGVGSDDLWYPGRLPVSAADVLYFESYVPQPGHFWRRSLLERLGGVDESLQYGFDLDLLVRCALAGARAAATHRLIAAFRFHASSKTTASRSNQDADTALVEARHFNAVRDRDGRRAALLRDRYRAQRALGLARDRLAAGETAPAWRLTADVARQYPTAVPTRAFLGTLQRLLGLRRGP